jgi:class 3 adenylate cyclase
MSDIARWLEELELAKYVAVFEANEIDRSALPELTEEDFREMGIPIGPRRKLLRAIRELSPSQSVAESEPESVSPPAVDDLPPSPGEAERRQLTVMFSDLIGSTELSAQLDPEDLRDLNRAYQVAVTAAIERFGGYVARYMGDGVLAYGSVSATSSVSLRASRGASRYPTRWLR